MVDVVSKVHNNLKKRTLVSGRIYVKASFNNVSVVFTDYHGNVQVWSKSGHVGFKGAKKSTPHAAQVVAQNVLSKIKVLGVKVIDVFLSGSNGSVRDAVVKYFAMQADLTILSIQDVTGRPHNGCRSRKKRKQ